MPPDFHQRNAAECAIRNFKVHFLVILAVVHGDFPSYLWDTLLPQTELILNLLRQDTLAPGMSVWEYYNDPVDYGATPFSSI